MSKHLGVSHGHNEVQKLNISYSISAVAMVTINTK